jgi:hypothetical protein
MGGRQGSVTAGSRGGSAAGGEARRLACIQEQRQAAAWELLRLLPRHAAMVRLWAVTATAQLICWPLW